MAKPSEQGERESVELPGRWRALVGVCLLLAGCTSGGQKVDEAMRADRGDTAARNVNVAARYHIRCPDVLEIAIDGRPAGRSPVAVDGRIDLGALGQPRIEEQTAQEIARQVAELAGVPAERVRVRVVEYNSQQVYLFGEVAGLQRAVAYQGEETIADLLHRAGGLTPGAAPARVQVIRPRVIEGRPPLVYNVDLEAVVMGRDQSTNLRVQPFDQIYVGETRKASLQRCIPPWLRPLYEAAFGLPARQGDMETPRSGDPEARKPDRRSAAQSLLFPSARIVIDPHPVHESNHDAGCRAAVCRTAAGDSNSGAREARTCAIAANGASCSAGTR